VRLVRRARAARRLPLLSDGPQAMRGSQAASSDEGRKRPSRGANGYAEALAKRNPAVLGKWGDEGTRGVASEAHGAMALKRDRDAKVARQSWEFAVRTARRAYDVVAPYQRPWVSCASRADVFEDRPERIEPRARLRDLIERTENLDWLLLTKRPENVLPLSAHWSLTGFPLTVWLGVRVEDQARADERIPLLLQTPAAVRFLSCEPLLGPVDLTQWLPIGRCQCRGGGCEAEGWKFRCGLPAGHDGGHCALVPSSAPWSGLRGEIQWVIAGGESGPHARRCDAAWLRSLRDQCRAAGVPFFCKQLGANAVSDDDTDSAHADSGSR
jgi:protein gp37